MFATSNFAGFLAFISSPGKIFGVIVILAIAIVIAVLFTNHVYSNSEFFIEKNKNTGEFTVVWPLHRPYGPDESWWLSMKSFREKINEPLIKIVGKKSQISIFGNFYTLSLVFKTKTLNLNKGADIHQIEKEKIIKIAGALRARS